MERVNIHILRKTTVVLLTYIVKNHKVHLDSDTAASLEVFINQDLKEIESLNKIVNEDLKKRKIFKDDKDYEHEEALSYEEAIKHRSLEYLEEGLNLILNFIADLDLPISDYEMNDATHFEFELSNINLDHTKISQDKIDYYIVPFLYLMMLKAQAFDVETIAEIYGTKLAKSTNKRIRDDIFNATHVEINNLLNRYMIKPGTYHIDDLIDAILDKMTH